MDTYENYNLCCFRMFVILNIFSRYVVGWIVPGKQAPELAEQVIADTAAMKVSEDGNQTLHPDRSSMRSEPDADLLAVRHIANSHSRPYTSDGYPCPEVHA